MQCLLAVDESLIDPTSDMQRSAVTIVTRQLRPTPLKVNDLQYKTFNTKEPNHLINTVQWNPPGYDSQTWTKWKQLECDGHNLTRSLELLAEICSFGLKKNEGERGERAQRSILVNHHPCIKNEPH